MSQTTNNAFKRIDRYSEWGPAGLGAPTERFKASRAYDKLIGLTTVVLVAAVLGAFVVPVGIAFACVLVAFGLAVVSWFKMQWARYLAPAYAVTEGIALGAISRAYSSLGHHIIPVAIVFTGAVFLGCLGLYRTGLVRVTPRFAAMAGIGAIGVMAVAVLSLCGLAPSLSGFGTIGLVVGILFLGVAILNLFTDFDYVRRSEQLGVSAEGEWAAAFAMLTALVLVYISLLRILASVYGGRRS